MGKKEIKSEFTTHIMNDEFIVNILNPNQPERSKREDSWQDRSMTNSQYEEFMKDTDKRCGTLNSRETD